MSTSWGVPASWLSKWIVNGLSAGAVSVATSNLMPDAVIASAPGAGPPEPPGPPDPAGPPDPPGAGDPPGVPPDAVRGGNQPAFSATAATMSKANTVRSVFGQAGGGSFSRCPVASARTT